MTERWVSVIVPTIGRPESLRLMLASLVAQSRRPEEVVVADGSVGDEVRQVVDDAAWAKGGIRVSRVVVHPPNAVRQRVAAIAASSGEYLLLLDDDVILEADCVKHLLAAITRGSHVVGAFADFNNQSWPRPTLAWRLYMQYVLGMRDEAWQGRVVGPLLRFGYNPPPESEAPMEWLATCNTLIRRSAYYEAGGFSDFFLRRCTMNEDVDLGLKLSRLGLILFCASARMGHFHAPGGRVAPGVAAEDDLYNRYLVMRRTLGRSAASAFGLVLTYFLVETASNLAGAALRLRGRGLLCIIRGRLCALGRILALSRVEGASR